MRVCIAILAHNEEEQIAGTIECLSSQSIFDMSVRSELGIDTIDLICVPNGCTDETTAMASKAFRRLFNAAKGVNFNVHDVHTAGKSNAWNVLVHKFAKPDADFIIFLDADIEIGHNDVFSRLLLALRNHPEARVSVSQPLKNLGRQAGLSLSDRISIAASKAREGFPVAIAGSLYCIRADVARKIWMPRGLPVEDGFLAAMIKTDGFTQPDQQQSIIRATDTHHWFDPAPGLTGFLRHEQRLIVGSVVNSWLYTLLWREGKRGHVGGFIRDRNAKDPAWFDIYVRKHVTRVWNIPTSFVVGRMLPLRGMSLQQKLVRAPLALLTTIPQFVACMAANTTIRKGRAVNFW